MSFNFPNQRISESKKNEEWHKSHIINYLTYATTSSYSNKKKEIAKLYYGYSAMIDKEDDKKICAMITERFGENFGPKYSVYPLIEGLIEQVVGKYRQRPLKRKCLVNNEKAVIKKLDKKVDFVTEQLLRGINKNAEQNVGFAPETENPDIEIPDDIQEFFEKDYRTLSEEVGEDILYQLLIVNKEKEKIFDALKNYLICERVFAFISEKDGHPSIFIPHILDCDFDIDPHESVQKDIQYFTHDKYSTINEIYNLYDLSEKEKLIIDNYNNGSEVSNENWFKSDGEDFRLRTVSMIWISRKKVNYKVITNRETGKEEYKLLPDNYKIRKRDREDKSIKNIEIEDIRNITMIGPDIVLEYGSIDNQMKTVGNKKKRFLPVVGIIGKNAIGTGEIRSLAKKLMDLQDFASEILYEIRIASRQTDGNVMVIDTSNIPKEWMRLGMNSALKKVNFHLKRDRIQVINSKDKRSNPYASSINVSQKGHINEMMQLFALIESLASKISGVSLQDQGQGKSYEKATVANINVNATSARLEEYFGPFDSFIETLLERLLLKSKYIYEESQAFVYFGGDNQSKFLTIFPEYFITDLGVHIGDNRKEYERNEKIEKVAEMAFANAQTPEMMLELIKVFNADNSTEKEAVLRKGIKALSKMRDDNAKAVQESEQQSLQQDSKKHEEDLNIKRESFGKDIEVAKIYANNKASDTNEKEQGQNRRKLADIEKELIIANKQNEKKN